MTKTQLLGIIDSLSRTVSKLKWYPKGTEWGDYYKDTNYTDTAFKHKKEIINDLVELVNPESVWDLGANMGVFSRLVSRKGVVTIAFDIDHSAVEQNYLSAKQHKDTNLLPLLLDLINPSPSLGWNNQERYSIQERTQADMVLALALIHHLAIANNVPLPDLGQFFSQLSPWLIIEFVPIDDPQVERLLNSRENIFPKYTFEGFEESFNKVFTIRKTVNIRESDRRIYLMERI
jgi:ribosomal protein L11 methylase PrmA